MRTSDEKHLESLYEEMDYYETETERGEREEMEMNHKYWEAYKEAQLEFEDELAEIDYEKNPPKVIEFLKELTQMVIEFNKPEEKRPTPTPEYIKSLQQADIQSKLDRLK
jgi:hypothetical protein